MPKLVIGKTHCDNNNNKKIKELKVLLGVERKKIMFDAEKVRSLTCMEKKSSELNYSLSFFSLLQVFTSFY